jgi:radical SAM superfamily enzyme with C-terminal helix-hairpin-helix motif
MLKIRDEQMKVFEEASLRNFEDRMVIHFRSNLLEQTKNMSEQDLRELIKMGIDRAELYEVTDEVDVERFLECMVRYGSDFDTDPKTSWAGEILRDESFTGTEKMNQINDYELFVITEDRS